MSHDSPAIEQPEQAAGQAASLKRTVTLMDWGTPPAGSPPTSVASPAAVQQSLPEAPAQQEQELEMEMETPMEMASDILPGPPTVLARQFPQVQTQQSGFGLNGAAPFSASTTLNQCFGTPVKPEPNQVMMPLQTECAIPLPAHILCDPQDLCTVSTPA